MSKASRLLAAKIEANTLRLIKRRLRVLERLAGINFVAFRLGIQPALAEKLLSGQVRLELDDLSDLALAVGCHIHPQIQKSHSVKRASARRS